MSPPPKSITLNEASARRLVLVQAIETSDGQGKLLSAVEREQIDRLALQSSRKESPVDPVDAVDAVQVEAFLLERSHQILRAVENRNPALASLQERRPWTQWLALGAFLAAVVFGAATDRVANPHRVDLLSLPLLAIIAWNLTVYGVLVASYFFHHRRPQSERPASASLMQWAQGWRGWQRRPGQMQAAVTAAFMRRWYGLSAALQAQRWRKVLHLAAAGWAFGVSLSLFTRGLVVEYRVGWESTFLNADQVHAILRMLLLPATALFPFQPFSVQDIASLQFSHGSGAVAGARWVYLYTALLAVVVIVPRLALAFYAGWREQRLSSRVVFSLADSYYQQLLEMMNPTRIQLGLLALRDQDRDALRRVLRPCGQPLHAAEDAQRPVQTLIRTGNGETLCIADVPPVDKTQQQLQTQTQAMISAPRWTGQAFGRLLGSRGIAPSRPTGSPYPAAHDDSDVVLLALQGVDDLEPALPALRASGKPALLLINPPAMAGADREIAAALCRAKLQSTGLQAEVLGFDQIAACWVQDPVLLDALGRCMPARKKETFARLADAWLKRNHALFAKSMQVIAKQLLDAAREVEEVPGALPFVKRLISPADRQAEAQARKDAMTAVLERLQHSVRRTHAQLLDLHAIDDATGLLLEQPLKENFDLQAPINATQAGLAGAATGAASGASVDLITGGMTLGAAAALGALIGGGAAFAGVAWKNRATPAGTTLVQLSDDMLRTMAQTALLRYLAVVHLERGFALEAGMEQRWQGDVAEALQAENARLASFWNDARSREAALQTSDPFAVELQALMQGVLRRLYPAVPG